MAVVKDPMYEEEYNCLTSDLVDGFPPSTNLALGSIMYAWDTIDKKLDTTFKLINATGSKEWFKII